ncbi:hypothetical protein OIE62_24655 [Streptomyces scopuliridis]|uniref:Uncharacterized protein n=1 Tax=Streptomyces scopuliridis TaxID=452529 RepID=A0ACD4ZJU5_9ACTN|nr:hypothetical protein [Streptomyces scopuliridis]WSB98430.1 hypothetical protein OG835_16290 [Streptomyces scopuliridis]WSC07869.1 hypothetical protein OIE62_24655 [Streptomyces scopuliridis]
MEPIQAPAPAPNPWDRPWPTTAPQHVTERAALVIEDDGPVIRAYYEDLIQIRQQQAVRRGTLAFALDGLDFGPDVIHGKRLPTTA